MYSFRKTTQAVTIKHAKTIHSVLQNPAVVPTAWFRNTQEYRINNFTARS